MLPSQTIEILKTLDKKELKRFGDFLQSPYFNNLTALIKIYYEVKKAHPEFIGSSLQSEVIFKKIYPNDNFKETRIQNLYAEFGTQLKKFLGYERFASEKTEIDIYTTEALMDKNLNKISQKVLNKFLEENNNGLQSDSDSFYKLLRMNNNYLTNQQFLREDGTEFFAERVNDYTETLMLFFFKNLFQLSALISDETVSQRKKKNNMNEIFDIVNIDKLFVYFDKNKPQYSSYLKIYYYMQPYVLRDMNEAQYNILKEEILKIIRLTSKITGYILIITIIHMLHEIMISKDKKYYREIFEFSKLFDELKFFPDKDIPNFSNGAFHNIFIVAIILKEYDWAEDFVNEYSQYLNKEFRKNQKNYSMGILSFKKGKYEKSLDYFNEVDMIDIFEKVQLRIYYMMNYIELKAYESALSSLNTLKQFYKDSYKDIPDIVRPLIPDALKYFAEIIKCEEEGRKADPILYKELHLKRFYQAAYIREKMDMLK